jgi:carboxylate-amine ligase
MRITDVCTRLEDALSIAALYQSLLRMLSRFRQKNLRWRIYPRIMLEENRWRAQRYGCTKSMIDLGRGEMIPFGALLEEILEMAAEDAAALGCVKEINHTRTILKRGTSACRQLDAFAEAKAGGADDREALIAVVDMLVRETAADLPEAT